MTLCIIADGLSEPYHLRRRSRLTYCEPLSACARGVQGYQFWASWLTRDIRTRVVETNAGAPWPFVETTVQTRNLTNTVTYRNDADELQITGLRVDTKLSALSLFHTAAGRLSPCQWTLEWSPRLQLQAPDIPQIVLQRRRFVRTSELRTQGVRRSGAPFILKRYCAKHRKNGAIHTHYYNI